jgi:ribonuclease R
MFPEKLSNDLCSLRPNEDRLVQSVVLDLDAKGDVRKVRFADGVIRSAARLTYTQVAAVLDGRVSGVPPAVLPMLRVANRLRKVLETRRRARGSVDLDLPEPRILLDVEGAMTGITIEPRNRAHRLIEEFMLAANEAVAAHLDGQGAPCLYRIHERPDPAKVENLAAFASGFGLDLPGDPERIRPGDVQKMLDAAEGRPEYPIVAQVALRSMKQARYAPENVGHFGLAAEVYTHFTSPIRRYPDLVVHRSLRAVRHGQRDALVRLGTGLDELGDSCSRLERQAEAAERELLDWKKIAFVRDRVGETFDGIVTGVAPFGLFVQLTENLVEGLLHVARLGGDAFAFSERSQSLLGARTRRAFRLGDRVRVTLDRVDAVLRRVDLSLAEAVPAQPERRGRRPTAPRRTPGGRRGKARPK